MNSDSLNISIYTYSNKRILLAFIGITTVCFLLTLAGQYLLLIDELYFNNLSEQLTFEEIQDLTNQSRKWSWLMYIVLPLLNLIKFTLITSCLSLGYYFISNQWKFNSFFYIVIQAELIQLLPLLVRLIWFLFFQTNYSFNDVQAFYPLSVFNLIEDKTATPYLSYLFQTLNLFELLYWIALAYGISQIVKMPVNETFGLVAASYGSGLLIWIMCIMFLTVSLL